LTIRRYIESDYEQVLVLHRIAMEAVGCYIDDPHINGDLDDIPGNYIGKNGEFVVGKIDGRIAAMGGFRQFGDGHAEIKRMRVDPVFQGRGYGRQILAHLENRAIELGYTGMILETSVKQTAAQRLYTRFGFIESSREMIEGFDCIWYRKMLTPAGKSAK